MQEACFLPPLPLCPDKGGLKLTGQGRVGTRAHSIQENIREHPSVQECLKAR